MYKPSQEWLDKHHAECQEEFDSRQEITQLTTRQMSAKMKRETGSKAGQITMYQSNENDINRVAWSACIDGVGWLAVTQNYTGQWDPKSAAEASARVEVYIELILGGPALVESIRRRD